MVWEKHKKHTHIYLSLNEKKKLLWSNDFLDDYI